MRWILSLFLASCLVACATTSDILGTKSHAHIPVPDKIYFIGQDLDAIRGYFGSGCCVSPDGTTAYLSLYRLRSETDFGGIGYDLEGDVLSPEASWGAGPVGAYQSVHEFQHPHLAIGLYIAETGMPGGLKQIADGGFDAEISYLGAFMKTVPGHVFLRIGYEFDGAWNTGQDDTDAYIAAYRHIVDRLRGDGVENGVYVWQASTSILDDLIEQKHEDITNWYPGDDYVDWLAFSWFSRPNTVPTVSSAFQAKRPIELVEEVMALARDTNKPVLIAESAPQGYDIAEGFRANINPLQDGPSGEGVNSLSPEQIWDEWYAPLFDWMTENHDTVRGFAYINVDWDNQPMWGPPYVNGFWGDSRLQASPELAARFNQKIEAWRALP